jgi:hypothetical protein
VKLLTSELTSEGAVLQGCEEGIQPSERLLLARFEIPKAIDLLDKCLLHRNWRQVDFNFLNDLHIKAWHYGPSFPNAKLAKYVFVVKKACVQKVR